MRNTNRSSSRSSKRDRHWGKATGDDKLYFILHNLISMLLFFWYALSKGLFENQTWSLWDIFSFEFLQFTGLIFGLSILFSYAARAGAYVILYLTYEYQGKTVKSFMQMNTNINAMFTFTYFMAALLSSVAFSVGLVTLLQLKLFDSESIFTLIGAYIITKIVIYLIVWAKWG